MNSCDCGEYKNGVYRMGNKVYVCAKCKEEVSEEVLSKSPDIHIPILRTIIHSVPREKWISGYIN